MNRQEFFQKVLEKVSSEDIPRISQAYWFAKQVHRNQKRDCGERYFEHCRRVADLLIDHGGTSADEIVVALIHDCVEDGFIPDGVIKALFGEEVAKALGILSKVTPIFDESTGVVTKVRRSDDEYFDGIRNALYFVRCVKLADRLDNLRSFAIWDEDRKQRYIIETETYILPIAHVTDGEFEKELKGEISAAIESTKGGT